MKEELEIENKEDENYQREIVKCNFCELEDERWKISEHEEELCSQREVDCINSIYGKVVNDI